MISKGRGVEEEFGCLVAVVVVTLSPCVEAEAGGGGEGGGALGALVGDAGRRAVRREVGVELEAEAHQAAALLELDLHLSGRKPFCLQMPPKLLQR